MEPIKEKVTPETIARTIILALAVVNQILTMCGKPIIPIEDGTITQVVSGLFLIVTALIAWWKNNSFSQAAIKADIVMKQEKLADKEAKKSEE